MPMIGRRRPRPIRWPPRVDRSNHLVYLVIDSRTGENQEIEMSQIAKAQTFQSLHVKGKPVLLYNAWDAGSAKAIVGAGAPAVATSSWAVAASQGHTDGESLPISAVREIVRQIVRGVSVPVSVDFEGGYSVDESGLVANLEGLIGLGIVGINFEDRVVSGDGLHPIDHQARRIAAIRSAATKAGVPLFINARTDLFLGRGTPDPKDSLGDALARGKAYAAAGASGYFVPGLKDETLIARLCEQLDLPINVMILSGVPSPKRLGELGVARISWGNIPYADAMAGVERAAKAIYG
jgi:2-methylisocitrate lyase-like PEP mutase family enzyme